MRCFIGIDLGSTTTKAVVIDKDRIQMKDRCAAGCGRYLGYIADEMNMGLHELGPLAMKAAKIESEWQAVV